MHVVSAAGLSQMQLQKSRERYENIPKNPLNLWWCST